VYHLYRRYDALPEPRRMVTMLSVLLAILVSGQLMRFVSEGAGWFTTIVPIFALIGLRMRYLLPKRYNPGWSLSIMDEMKWEPIGETMGRVESARLWVPGGWIVRTVVTRLDAGVHCNQVFVPDPYHAWDQVYVRPVRRAPD